MGVYLYLDKVVYAEQVFESLLYGGKEPSLHLWSFMNAVSAVTIKPVGYGLGLEATEESVDLDGVDRVATFTWAQTSCQVS